jgi:hypothetical protein
VSTFHVIIYEVLFAGCGTFELWAYRKGRPLKMKLGDCFLLVQSRNAPSLFLDWQMNLDFKYCCVSSQFYFGDQIR